jgi:hypothetical protein
MNCEAPDYATFSSSLLLPPSLAQISVLVFYSRTYFSIRISDQIFTPTKTVGKIIKLHILIFCFVDSKWKDKLFLTEL